MLWTFSGPVFDGLSPWRSFARSFGLLRASPPPLLEPLRVGVCEEPPIRCRSRMSWIVSASALLSFGCVLSLPAAFPAARPCFCFRRSARASRSRERGEFVLMLFSGARDFLFLSRDVNRDEAATPTADT